MANDTIANNLVGWVAGPTERGTLNLVWSCMLTVFACTWTVLHLNVPSRYDGPWERTFRKVKWMFINLLFPEFILSKAVCDLRLAIQELEEFRAKWGTYSKPIEWIEGYYDEHSHSPITHVWEPAELPTFLQKTKSVWLFDRKSSTSSDAEKRPARSTTKDPHPTTQKWTLEHSYYAQMGGLKVRYKNRVREYLFTASCLTSRWNWNWEAGGPDEHPLMHLFLEKQDIQDKSKTDWLSKGVAIGQGIWTILNVIVRHVTGLPVTQIEIATVAFAIMAVFIYLANWWKPQDVSRSTTLHFRNYKRTLFDPVGDKRVSVKQRLLRPAEAGAANNIRYMDRVPNDYVLLEGDQPLLFYLMGAPSLIFGGLHCLAWKAEFPTKVEMSCWRIASLVSAILPVVALAISTVTLHLAGTYSDNQTRSKVLSALQREPLDQLSEEWWQLVKGKTAELKSWQQDARIALVLSPKEARNWEQAPTPGIIEHYKQDSAAWERGKWKCDQFFRILSCVNDFRVCLNDARLGKNDWFLIPKFMWSFHGEVLTKLINQSEGVGMLWCEFEDMITSESKSSVPDTTITCAEALVHAYDEAKDVFPRMAAFRKKWSRVPNIVTIFGVTVYAIARLTIIVLLFTSLRSMPAGVYQNTTWTRFLPNIS